MATRIAGGGTTKALSVDQFFEYLQGLSDEPDIEAVYQTVAWCYRCVNLRANALGAIPYTILRGENETEWPIPLHDLWWVTESALCLFGAAYWLKRANRSRRTPGRASLGSSRTSAAARLSTSQSRSSTTGSGTLRTTSGRAYRP